MVIKLHSGSCRLRKRRDDEQSPQLERSVSHFLPEAGQIVLVGTSGFLDQAVHSETFEHSGHLESRFVRHDRSKRTVLESPDVEFSTDHSFKQLQILAVEEIKTAVGSLAIRGGLRDLLKILDADGSPLPSIPEAREGCRWIFSTGPLSSPKSRPDVPPSGGV
jgi:hypothetical protein